MSISLTYALRINLMFSFDFQKNTCFDKQHLIRQA